VPQTLGALRAFPGLKWESLTSLPLHDAALLCDASAKLNISEDYFDSINERLGTIKMFVDNSFI